MIIPWIEYSLQFQSIFYSISHYFNQLGYLLETIKLIAVFVEYDIIDINLGIEIQCTI